VDISAEHARVVACLIEKAETTPDSYPLTTNALRAACNQATNRDPVVDYDDREVDALMLELRQFGLARTVKGSGHRVAKHKHVLDEALDLDGDELAVLAVLLLRGPQTIREIVTRTARYTHGPEGDEAAADAAIDRLVARPEPFARRLQRGPGEREPRILQCWAPIDGDVSLAHAADTTHDADSVVDSMLEASATNSVGPQIDVLPPAASTQPAAFQAPTPVTEHRTDESLQARVAALETQVAEQRRRLDRIAAELGLDELAELADTP
jgi:uncharacterized protein YceH (UPF0502 family)